MATDSQINANRANALLSTGPTTSAGKAKSSINAVKTGLTGRTVLLPGDDAKAYKNHVKRFFDKHNPASDDEADLVQSLADTEWRLLRIPALETGIYAIGRLEFAEKFAAEQDERARTSFIEAQVFLAYQRQLNNLSIQERPLRSQREQDRAELNRLQEDRRTRERKQLQQAVELYQEAQKEGKPFNPAEFGFVFSMESFHERLAWLKASRNHLDPDIEVLKYRRDRKAA